MVNAKIKFEQITEKTFPDLKELVLEQAFHHSSTYRGDDKKFIEALERKDAVPQIITVRNDDTQEPLGYILFNHYHGFKGQELYMEDLLVSNRERSQGFGLKLTEELKEYGRDLGIPKVTWAVAENNPNAIRFYEQKMLAHVQPYAAYDCGDLYQKPIAAPAEFEVRRVTTADLDLLDTDVGQLPGLTKEKMDNIRDAAGAPNARVYAAFDSAGVPQGLGITNSNFSSFRAVYGYKFEVMELTADKEQAVGALKALTAFVTDAGKADNDTGHLNIYIDDKSQAQTEFMQGLGFTRLQMTDDAASVCALRRGHRGVTPKATPAAPANDLGKKPGAPKAP